MIINVFLNLLPKLLRILQLLASALLSWASALGFSSRVLGFSSKLWGFSSTVWGFSSYPRGRRSTFGHRARWELQLPSERLVYICADKQLAFRVGIAGVLGGAKIAAKIGSKIYWFWDPFPGRFGSPKWSPSRSQIDPRSFPRRSCSPVSTGCCFRTPEPQKSMFF